jgi:hypothetical protein
MSDSVGATLKSEISAYLVKLGAVLIIGGAGYASWYGTTTVSRVQTADPGPKGVPSAQAQLDDTLARADTLLELLRKSNWDKSKVPVELLRVPAQEFAANAFDRRPEAQTFSIGDPFSNVYDDVAFYSPLFVKQNLRKGSGPEGVTASPQGVFIVGWKNGGVRTVPIEDVRLLAHPKIENAFNFVFPGMKAYKSSLPKYFGVTENP